MQVAIVLLLLNRRFSRFYLSGRSRRIRSLRMLVDFLCFLTIRLIASHTLVHFIDLLSFLSYVITFVLLGCAELIKVVVGFAKKVSLPKARHDLENRRLDPWQCILDSQCNLLTSLLRVMPVEGAWYYVLRQFADLLFSKCAELDQLFITFC